MFGKKRPKYYAAWSIRHNGKTFKMGHLFSEEELKNFTEDELEQLIQCKAITTNKEAIDRTVMLIAEREKAFAEPRKI